MATTTTHAPVSRSGLSPLRPTYHKGEAFMVLDGAGEGTSGTAQGRGLRLGGGAIASISGLGLLIIFMVQNTADVTLHFLFWSFTWPLWLFTLVIALVGALAWFGLGVMRRHRRRKARRAARRA